MVSLGNIFGFLGLEAGKGGGQNRAAGSVWPRQSSDSDCNIAIIRLPGLDAAAIWLHKLVVAEAWV